MDTRIYKALILGAALLGAVPARAKIDSPDLGLLQEQNRIKRESEGQIQKDILDPILGKGRAMVFVDVEMELKLEREESARSGVGLAERYREKLGVAGTAGPQTTFVLPGIPKPKTISQGPGSPGDKPESVRAQQNQQVRGIEEERFAMTPVFKRLTVTVLHDNGSLKSDAQKKLVRDSIVDAMSQYKLQADQVVFRPIQFHQTQAEVWDWRKDLQRPDVYLPLIFALLLSLLLGFLFGPLARFFRQYVEALREKPGAEVDIDSTMENEEGEGGGGGGGPEESKLDIMLGQKAPELPPEEDESMKKFEPFSYINEENIKRLVYMFMLRKEEPWVIAVVCTYLRPEYARQIITSLPLELQAKVAIEALTVRQVTREQVVAIDQDIKESVDFVVGGMERLLAMLDEADTATRNNILSYLKNEKPTVYEKVRKYILVFEDFAGFPDREMQTIVRELKAESMARALQNAAPEVVEKFFANMSTGAASLLKEAMEYSKGLTPAQIDEERAKILDLVKVMEKEGKIVVREKPQEGVDLHGMQEELSAQQRRQARFSSARGKGAPAEPAAAAAPSPFQPPAGAGVSPQDQAQAKGYYDYGLSLFNAGQLEQSLPYFQHALALDAGQTQAHQYLGNAYYQLGRTWEALAHFEKLLESNPDPQLRAWVESFKAQMNA